MKSQSLKRPRDIPFGNIGDNQRGDIKRLINPPIYRNDDYYWIRDDERQNPEILELLESENKTTKEVMACTQSLQEELFLEMKCRVQENKTSFPYKFYSSDYVHYTKYFKGSGYPVYYRKNKLEQEELLLDVNDIALNRTNCDVVNVKTSFDGKILSYCVDYQGNEEYELVLKDLETNKSLEYNIKPLLYAKYLWSYNNKEIYYVLPDGANRMCELYVYDIFTHTNKLLYREDDLLFSLEISHSSDLKYIFVDVHSSTTSEGYMINPNVSHQLHLIKDREPGIKYQTDIYDNNHLLIKTNINGMTNFGLMYQSFDPLTMKFQKN